MIQMRNFGGFRFEPRSASQCLAIRKFCTKRWKNKSFSGRWVWHFSIQPQLFSTSLIQSLYVYIIVFVKIIFGLFTFATSTRMCEIFEIVLRSCMACVNIFLPIGDVSKSNREIGYCFRCLRLSKEEFERLFLCFRQGSALFLPFTIISYLDCNTSHTNINVISHNTNINVISHNTNLLWL